MAAFGLEAWLALATLLFIAGLVGFAMGFHVIWTAAPAPDVPAEEPVPVVLLSLWSGLGAVGLAAGAGLWRTLDGAVRWAEADDV